VCVLSPDVFDALFTRDGETGRRRVIGVAP
jgi:hypothetical protein